MKYRTRRYFTESDKVLMSDHWQKGDSLHLGDPSITGPHGLPGVLFRCAGTG
jgi:hypothetical protein